jgi:uncharacterized protein YbaR (Trm112 family)
MNISQQTPSCKGKLVVNSTKEGKMKLSLILAVSLLAYTAYAKPQKNDFICTVCELLVDKVKPLINSTDIIKVSLFKDSKVEFLN